MCKNVYFIFFINAITSPIREYSLKWRVHNHTQFRNNKLSIVIICSIKEISLSTIYLTITISDDSQLSIIRVCLKMYSLNTLNAIQIINVFIHVTYVEMYNFIEVQLILSFCSLYIQVIFSFHFCKVIDISFHRSYFEIANVDNDLMNMQYFRRNHKNKGKSICCVWTRLIFLIVEIVSVMLIIIFEKITKRLCQKLVRNTLNFFTFDLTIMNFIYYFTIKNSCII
ncbi:hypothetical protein AGLY_002583 [Aphis glycines]|uniref:Uncharacterized protein n=1 Tax=Aphis glycines TaxID=307491 RepID=A0A6G0U307_APHGL|nr:hypothetical protein AGLY_002583 [Aphis glycines]